MHICLLKQKEISQKRANAIVDPYLNDMFDRERLYDESWLNDDGLSPEQKAQEKVQNLLIREFDVFSRETRNKEYDPMTL